MHDAVVVGGGIAGLTVVYRLLAAGRQVICLEADPVAGGCVRTDRVEGLLCERGAQNVLEEPGGPVHRLAKDLGISAEILYPREKGNFIAWGGHLCSMPAQLHRVLSVGGMVRAARGLLLAKAPADSEESVAVWARRRFGGEFASRVIDPMISGICAGDPERLSLDAAFPELGNLEQRHRSLVAAAFRNKTAKRHHYSFRKGMGALTGALAQHVGSALRTGIKATAVTADGSGQYRIDCEDPITGTQALPLFAGSVIIATPAAAAAEMMSALDPSLGPLFGSIESAPVVTASLAFSPADFDSGPPVGYGLVRPRCEGSRLLGCLFPSSAFEGTAPPGVVHLRVLAGGRRDPDAYGLSDDELLDLTREELRPFSDFGAMQSHPSFTPYGTGSPFRNTKSDTWRAFTKSKGRCCDSRRCTSRAIPITGCRSRRWLSTPGSCRHGFWKGAPPRRGNSMPVSSRRSELLAYLEPFQVGSGRRPDSREMEHLQTLIRDLAKENPLSDLETGFIRLAGLWRCIFTSSRFVLGLNSLRVARLSAVYQSIVVDPDGKAGHYFNIGEMSRAGRVCGACGEYASIHPSGAGPGRLDVQYHWFYMAFRVWSSYEGFKSLSDRLETGHVHRKIRFPFHKAGWQWNAYLDDQLRVVFGSEGGIFVLVREPSAGSV